MTFILPIILLAGAVILRNQHRQLIKSAVIQNEIAGALLKNASALRDIQSSGTWLVALLLAQITWFFLNSIPSQAEITPFEINLGIGLIFILAGCLGSLSEYSFFKLAIALPNIELDRHKYRKKVILGQLIKWLFVVALIFGWITIVSITFARSNSL